MKKSKVIQAFFYSSSQGKEPVRDFLLSLSKEDRISIGADVKTVEYGWPIGMPVCRAMGDSLYAVRSNISNGRIARILFCFKNQKMVLLHGFIKKAQKTPKPDLDLARKRQKEVDNE